MLCTFVDNFCLRLDYTLDLESLPKILQLKIPFTLHHDISALASIPFPTRVTGIGIPDTVASGIDSPSLLPGSQLTRFCFLGSFFHSSPLKSSLPPSLSAPVQLATAGELITASPSSPLSSVEQLAATAAAAPAWL